MIELALTIIDKAFAGKFDKAGQPYVDHLKRVSSNCPEQGSHNEVKVVALLHDILEDCDEWNENLLRTYFTDEIVDAVVAMTHKEGQTYDDYITQILKNKWATIVKKYDLEDNMDIKRLKELTDKDLLRLQKYHRAYLRIIGYSFSG